MATEAGFREEAKQQDVANIIEKLGLKQRLKLVIVSLEGVITVEGVSKSRVAVGKRESEVVGQQLRRLRKKLELMHKAVVGGLNACEVT